LDQNSRQIGLGCLDCVIDEDGILTDNSTNEKWKQGKELHFSNQLSFFAGQ
jgi:hypothetical protein